MKTQTQKLKTAQAPAAIPTFYRVDLFKRAKKASKHSLFDLSIETGLAINTVKAVVDGCSSNLIAIHKVATFYRIDWLDLFDVENRLCHNDAGNIIGVRTVSKV